MDKQRACKICNRRFANGKAMGGHMRSHLAKLPVLPKPNNPVVELAPTFSRLPSSSSSLSFPSGSRDHMQNFRPVNHRVQDRESETESPRNPTRRRSKRRRRVILSTVAPPPPSTMAEPDSVSSVTESFTDEEIAVCLLMLSRDKWPEEDRPVVDYREDDEVEEDGDKNEDGHELFSVKAGNGKGKYECEICKKIFPSYQALGGHKASHKKINLIKFRGDHRPVQFKPNNNGLEEESTSAVGDGVSDRHQIHRAFECQFCDKVFESGQALGGHKKVHFPHLSVTPKPQAGHSFKIDLNLPAPLEDSEESHI